MRHLYRDQAKEAIEAGQKDFSGMALWSPDLRGYDLSGVSFRGAYFFMMPLLMRANLDGADFTDAKLLGAQLQGASLRGTLFDGALLIGTMLDGADVAEAFLAGAKVIFPSLGIPPNVLQFWEPYLGTDHLYRLRRRTNGGE